METIRIIILVVAGLAGALIFIVVFSNYLDKGGEIGTRGIEKSGGGILCNIDCERCCQGTLSYPEGHVNAGDTVLEGDCDSFLRSPQFGCGGCTC